VRIPDRLIRLGLGCTAALLISAAYAADPPPEQRLDAVQRSLAQSRQEHAALAQKAHTLAAQLAELQAQSIAAARGTQESESALTQLEQSETVLAADEARQSAALSADRTREAALLAALVRIATMPPGAMVFQSDAPIDVARSGMLASAAVPRIQAELQKVTDALEHLKQSRADLAAKRTEIAAQRESLAADRQRVAALIDQKQLLAGETRAKADAAQKRIAQLTAQANDLKQLIEKLDQEREDEQIATFKRNADPPPPPPPPTDTIGTVASVPKANPDKLPESNRFIVPVVGDIVGHFGDAQAAGSAKGVTFATRLGAEIVAPAAGRVMFAGPFKGYGQILIIDHGDGYHSLLAGIGRITGIVGQHVAAGEPIGTMASDGTPRLYLELRRQGQPVNPLPFLAAHDGKASG